MSIRRHDSVSISQLRQTDELFGNNELEASYAASEQSQLVSPELIR